MQQPFVTYREYLPHPLLQDYIKTYWSFECGEGTTQLFDIIPDGYFDMIISLQNNCIADTTLVGIWSKLTTVQRNKWNVIGIRFKPLALSVLLDMTISDLLDGSASVDLSDWHLNSNALNDNLNISENTVFDYLDSQFLLKLHFNQHKQDKRLTALFHLIDRYQGIISVQTISDSIGLSTRQMQRKVTDLLGIGTKDYANIIRFSNNLDLIKGDPANYQGYFDQAHFIKEFKRYTGITPSKIDLSNSVRFLQYYDLKNP